MALLGNGERAFKSHVLVDIDLAYFLNDEFKERNRGSEIHRSWLKDKWHRLLCITLSYFTCEGRFNQLNMYHFLFVSHITGQVKMNTSYCLLMSLKQISVRVMERPNASSHFIYHKGFIKLLVENHLRIVGRTWEHFLFWGSLNKL